MLIFVLHTIVSIGSFLLLPAYGRVGQGQYFLFLASHFAKQNTKNCGGEKFSALPREARQSKFAIRIFVKKGSSFAKTTADKSDFNQKAPPIKKSGTNPDFLIAVGAGLEPARAFLPAAFQERYLTIRCNPPRNFCGGGGTRTHRPLFRRLQVSNLLQYHYATPPF